MDILKFNLSKLFGFVSWLNTECFPEALRFQQSLKKFQFYLLFIKISVVYFLEITSYPPHHLSENHILSADVGYLYVKRIIH